MRLAVGTVVYSFFFVSGLLITLYLTVSFISATREHQIIRSRLDRLHIRVQKSIVAHNYSILSPSVDKFLRKNLHNNHNARELRENSVSALAKVMTPRVEILNDTICFPEHSNKQNTTNTFLSKCRERNFFRTLWKCPELWQHTELSKGCDSNRSSQFRQIMEPLCSTPLLRDSLSLDIDCRFEENYHRMFSSTGGVSRAFLVQIGEGELKSHNKEHNFVVELLRSIKEVSDACVIVFTVSTTPTVQKPNYYPYNEKANQVSGILPPLEHPHLVHFRVSHNVGNKSLHSSYDALKMVLLANASTMVLLHTNMIVGPRIDLLFRQAEFHIGPRYPYPMLSAFNMAHSCPVFTSFSLEYVAGVLKHGFNVVTSNRHDWLSITHNAAPLKKYFCKWDVSLHTKYGQHIPLLWGYAYNLRTTVHGNPSNFPSLDYFGLDNVSKTAWPAPGYFAQYRGKYFFSTVDFLKSQPGCVV
eukprot:m.18736 g.18736  ORF g.18736 m.18736 type:complete len:471 (-) comp11566_c0_seq1:64-1476(-)